MTRRTLQSTDNLPGSTEEIFRTEKYNRFDRDRFNRSGKRSDNQSRTVGREEDQVLRANLQKELFLPLAGHLCSQ